MLIAYIHTLRPLPIPMLTFTTTTRTHRHPGPQDLHGRQPLRRLRHHQVHDPGQRPGHSLPPRQAHEGWLVGSCMHV